MAKFKALYQECFVISGAITSVGACFESDSFTTARICQKLGSDGWSYLLANDAQHGYIQVAVECVDGKLQVNEIKPAGATIAAGTELYFDWSDDAWCARFDCKKVEDANGEAQDIADMFKSDAFNVSVNDDGQICIEPKEGVEGCAGKDDVWVWCNRKFWVENGKIRVGSIDNPVPDQTFDPAKVIMKNGKPEFSASSCPPLEKPSCDPCLQNQKGN